MIEVRRATIADLDTVIELRIALLREYKEHPIYGRMHPQAEERARPVFLQQIQSPDQFNKALLGALGRFPAP